MRLKPRFSVLAAAAALGMLPAAALGETVTVTGIAIEGQGNFRISVPTVEATDANLDEAGIRALFATDYATTARNLAALDAASISIPALTMTYEVATGTGTSVTTTVTYSDFELTDVTDGVAAAASIGMMEMRSSENPSVVTVGRMSTGLLDLGGIVDFYGLGAGSDRTEMTPLYENFEMEGATLVAGSFHCDIGPARAERFSARPTKGSFEELLTIGAELEAAETSGEAPSPAAIAKVVEFYADFLTAFESTPMTVDGITCQGVDESGKEASLSTGPFTVGGFKPGRYPSVGLDDFRMDIVDDGWMAFNNFTWKEMDLNGPLAVLLEAKDALSEAWFEANWRKIIPVIEGFSLAGFGMDIPDPQTPGGRIKAQIGALDVTLADYVNGIPSRISAKGTGIEVPVPEGAEGRQLSAAGIETLLIDYDLLAHWDEAGKTIAVDTFALTGADLGGFNLTGTIANAGPELFSPNPEIATAAATGLTVTKLTLEVENAGLAPLLIAIAAAEEGMAPEALHATFAGLARALPLATLGATPDTLKLSNALGAFLDGAPKLTLTLTATDPKGIGLAELMEAEENPALLKDKVTIVAEVEGEPVPFAFPEIAPPQPTEPDDGGGPVQIPDAAPPQPAMPMEPSEGPATREDAKRNAKN